MGGVFKEVCKNGHNMSETRKWTPKGVPYCWKCKGLYVKVYQKNNPEQVKNTSWKHKLKKKFNMTVEDYDNMYNNQNGKCGICLNEIDYSCLLYTSPSPRD